MKVEQGEGYTKVKDEMREEEGKRRERVSGHISQQILKKKREMKRERERGLCPCHLFFYYYINGLAELNLIYSFLYIMNSHFRG